MSHGGGVELPESHGDHPSEPFTKKVALCVAIYAVILAVSGTGGKNAGKDMLVEQIAASNVWGRFQAKSIREAMNEKDKEKLEIELTKPDLTELTRKQTNETLEKTKKTLARYEKEKEELSEEAKKHEKDRDIAHKKDSYFDYAELLLQLAIVLASVTMLSGSRWPFLVSIGLVVVGLILTLNGFMLFMQVGVIEGGAH